MSNITIYIRFTVEDEKREVYSRRTKESILSDNRRLMDENRQLRAALSRQSTNSKFRSNKSPSKPSVSAKYTPHKPRDIKHRKSNRGMYPKNTELIRCSHRELLDKHLQLIAKRNHCLNEKRWKKYDDQIVELEKELDRY